MRRAIIILFATAFALAACDDPAYRPAEAPTVIEPMNAPPVEDDSAARPPAAEAPPAPTDYAPLPSEPRSSEESVQPESETLFF